MEDSTVKEMLIIWAIFNTQLINELLIIKHILLNLY